MGNLIDTARAFIEEPRPLGSGLYAHFEDRHASTQAYIEYIYPRCVELARVLKKTSSVYYHYEWHVSRSPVWEACDA